MLCNNTCVYLATSNTVFRDDNELRNVLCLFNVHNNLSYLVIPSPMEIRNITYALQYKLYLPNSL
jgi:hypothetical protein